MPALENMAAVRHVEDAATAAQIVESISIPGTELMRDVGDVHFTHAGHGQVYVPMPFIGAFAEDAQLGSAAFI